MEVLLNKVAERAVLSGICRHGLEAYLDCADMINESCFVVSVNRNIYSCIKKIFEDGEEHNVDLALFHSTAQQIGLSGYFTNAFEAKYLNAIIDFPIELKNVRRFAAQIGKLNMGRLIVQGLEDAKGKYLELTGEETISHILGIAEDTVFNFSSMFNDNDDEPIDLKENIVQHLIERGENPVDQVGIPTGFDEYDRAIGGGLRPATVNILGARSGVGKTSFAINVANHITSLPEEVKVLYLDTEMLEEDHYYKGMARATEIGITEIETGQFYKDEIKKDKVLSAAKNYKGYSFKSIAGLELEEQLAIMRRWIMKEVGLDEHGHAKPCVIIYDYVKLMTSDKLGKNLAEYQQLGFLMTSLHNFTTRYRIPIFAGLQLNRDGLTEESAGAAAGSDRIIWLCSNFTIFKYKSEEEMQTDATGNTKLVPIKTRHGPGLEFGDYINCHTKGWCAKITEGKTKKQIEHESSGFGIDDNEDVPFE